MRRRRMIQPSSKVAMTKATIHDTKRETERSVRHNFPGSRFPSLSPPLGLSTILLLFVLAVIVTLFVWYLRS